MEIADRELEHMIQRRAPKEPDRDEMEPSYAESVRRFNARRREENRELWGEYFDHLAHSLRARAAEYEQRAEQLQRTSTKHTRGEGGS